MADEITSPTTETAPAVPPTGGGTATPTATGGQSQAAPPDKRHQKRGREIRIPESAFKARVAREAAAEVRRRLGVSMEEAEKAVKSGGTPTTPVAGGAPAAVQANQMADEAVKKLQRDNERLKLESARHKKMAEDTAKKGAREIARMKDKQVEAELRQFAASAGFNDPDIFIHMFMRAVVADKALTPQGYVEKLKATHAYMFGVAPPPPVKVMPSTAPPESKQPGEKKPEQQPAGNAAASPKTPDVEKMSPQEFARHARGYGYTPGMS